MREVGWAIYQITKPLTTGAFAAAIALGFIYAVAKLTNKRPLPRNGPFAYLLTLSSTPLSPKSRHFHTTEDYLFYRKFIIANSLIETH
ncbi:hypothetical protein [Aneurinibacillus aneurinilyticus]|uniref:Uncharacterized protein n=1 Tax=Aneurinibacillus aneurinilyticus ATCC 12856 TaxID=649747 RepID=U1Y6B4_ANEAE|nr:hypothetical protein [Aneurinibacillus aneurinilyticus]ERI06406.1 hypothetical protein HMPREF0083_05343 [Aneurinibacillus aneurinilyticus ATCC 12856]MED0709404.1 hypothetical protein [Aneurinibacillus aneurinilyticus]MED0725539.1 hypothetical protein [Aneurinibacillus aneurinilyticus]MED0735367.1 hypothetical protein [Aneurinibacillus aneurinilyticus]MED0744182.1 hypothetical protein [Aneurinibacillus aneurinilyticus]